MCWFTHDYFISRVIDTGDVTLTQIVPHLGLMEKITREFYIQKTCRTCGRSVFNTKYRHELNRAELSEITFRLETQHSIFDSVETDRQPLLMYDTDSTKSE